MSLARGFTYAGASDLVASLWKVNAGSTAEIMQYFYQNLKEGKNKSAALQAAKKQYLENVKGDEKRSPYYWAGFVSIGVDTKMDFSEIVWHWWMIGGILLFGAVWWTGRKKQVW